MFPETDSSQPDFLLRRDFLTFAEQKHVLEVLRSLPVGFYTPKTRWGRPMSVRMNCLGWHWSAKDYKYHSTRVDVDQAPCPAIPPPLLALARRSVLETGYLQRHEYRPFDICIVNWYGKSDAKLGDHVDNSETPETLAAGYPVVSLSIGASCVFRMGGPSRRDPFDHHTLLSGDLIVFGRSKRLAFHGIKEIFPETTPAELGLGMLGRFNLTFRLR